ncbi:MAG: YitT family protein [Deltaproteobacteria bacterium]|nr:YitT family protein [Deltaproteobacteria bacterium]
MKRPPLFTQLKEEGRELWDALKTPRFYGIILTMVAGMLLITATINALVIPNKLVSPGITGVSLILNYLGLAPSVGVAFLALNIPIFLAGWREFALKHTVLSILGVGLFSLLAEVTRDVRVEQPDRLMTSLLAGLATGGGAGLYLRLGATAGGMDVLALIARKRLGVTMGSVFISINVVILASSWMMFDINTLVYSGVYMFANSWAVERVQTGFSQRRVVLIVSSKPQVVAEEVIRRLDRGVTFLHAEGGFSGKESRVIFSVINLMELGRMKDLLYQTDPDALMTVLDTTEVIGRKFQGWEEQGFRPTRG